MLYCGLNLKCPHTFLHVYILGPQLVMLGKAKEPLGGGASLVEVGHWDHVTNQTSAFAAMRPCHSCLWSLYAMGCGPLELQIKINTFLVMLLYLGHFITAMRK